VTRYQTDLLDLRLMDCMDLMRDTPDGFYDLAIVDPPYGIGESGGKDSRNRVKSKSYQRKEWDNEAPPIQYFNELRRVSKHQIIWGANHFIERVMRGSPAWIVWDKMNGECDFADAELAYSSFTTACRVFRFRWAGMLQGDMANKETRIHPTQKPVALYNWLLANYAKPGQRILDTHLGSGSHAIACHYFGAHLTATEIDPDYCAAACERIERETRQADMFTPSIQHPTHEQTPLL